MRRKKWSLPGQKTIGINTGCSGVIPFKKLTVSYQRQMIASFLDFGFKVVLLGGPEDRIRNQQIAYGLDVVQSPTNQGLRDGMISVAACDIIISGDSLGMHLGIAMKKMGGCMVWPNMRP